jgi:hypothetical protein
MSDSHFVVFLPYLRLKQPYQVAGVNFIPLRTSGGSVAPELASAVVPVAKILSGYVNMEGAPLDECVVATINGAWDLKQEDLDAVRWAASLLFLAAWASNEYFPKFGGDYVNSTQFQVIGQAYNGDMPHYIAFSTRRRDGGITNGGYAHGEVKFHLPVQVRLDEAASVDVGLLAGIDAAHAVNNAVTGRLRTALPFVQQANTDDGTMTWHAEAILMSSAFEQLLRGDASAYTLGRKFGGLFKDFGSATVGAVQKVRTDIRIDAAPTDHWSWRVWVQVRDRFSIANDKVGRWLAARHKLAQQQWWVHRIWITELYDVRSKAVHKGTTATRPWGWSVFEHLVMAAHVFPLTVKLQLAAEKRYTLTDEDRVRCLIVDKILASPRWAADPSGKSEESWSRILSDTQSHLAFENAIKAVQLAHPELFTGDGTS